MKPPAGFVAGPKWYSYDNGKTWTRKPRKLKELRGFLVTAVDYKAGVVTVSANMEGR